MCRQIDERGGDRCVRDRNLCRDMVTRGLSVIDGGGSILVQASFFFFCSKPGDLY